MKPAPFAPSIKPADAPPRHDGLVLAVACLAVAFAIMLEERPGGRLALWGRDGLALPNVCASRIVLGIACPGCGLTRAVVRLAHGDGPGSWRLHRLGVPTAILILAQIPYRLVVIGRRVGPLLARRLTRGQEAS